MLRLHHAPLACSLASRFALKESGLEHEVAIVRTSRGEQKAEAYLRINPRGQVPALETDEGVLTETSAILPYIADLVPEKALFPPAGTFVRATGQAWLSFLSSTLHAALSDVMFPGPGADNDAAREARLASAISALRDVDAHLEGRDHVLDGFSVCDLYLGVLSLWRAAPAFSGQLPAFPNLDRFQQTLLARPALGPIVGDEMRLRMEG